MRSVSLVLFLILFATPLIASEIDQSFVTAADVSMAKMMGGMDIKASGDVDRDFVAMMVPHHRAAIEMATLELQYGHNVQLKRLAQEIIVTQQDETTAMRLAIGEVGEPHEH